MLMEQELCRLKHESIDKHLETNDKRLDNHGDRIDKLEQGQSELTTHLSDLCKKLDRLIDVLYDIIKSTVGGIIVLGVAFIIWYIQKL